jgi:hypothetical protein
MMARFTRQPAINLSIVGGWAAKLKVYRTLAGGLRVAGKAEIWLQGRILRHGETSLTVYYRSIRLRRDGGS